MEIIFYQRILVYHNHLKSKDKKKFDPILGTLDPTRKVKAQSVDYFKSITLPTAALAQPAVHALPAAAPPPPPPRPEQPPPADAQPPPAAAQILSKMDGQGADQKCISFFLARAQLELLHCCQRRMIMTMNLRKVRQNFARASGLSDGSGTASAYSMQSHKIRFPVYSG